MITFSPKTQSLYDIMKNLEYIKANGKYYSPQKAGEQNPRHIKGSYFDVYYIKKLMFGRWQIDYYDTLYWKPNNGSDNQIPNARIILYPSGIEEIKFKL